MPEIILTCKALVFDLDGVLIDSYAAIERYWRSWAGHHGLDADQFLSLVHGMRSVDAIRVIAPHLDAEWEAAQLATNEVNHLEGVSIMEGANQLLKVIPENCWAIATSGRRRIALARIRHVGLPLPEVLVAADDVQHGKPHPQVYLTAAQRLGFSPESCLVVEDAPAGVEAALAAGMRVIALATGCEPARLRRADFIAARLADIHVLPIGEKDGQSSGALSLRFSPLDSS